MAKFWLGSGFVKTSVNHLFEGFFCPRLVPTRLWWSLKCGKMGSKLKTARISVVHESTFCRKFKQNVSMVENYNLFSSLVRNANKTCDFLMSVSAKRSRWKKYYILSYADFSIGYTFWWVYEAKIFKTPFFLNNHLKWPLKTLKCIVKT